MIISKAFYVGKFEVTQSQWQAIMGNNPAYFKKAGNDAPVESVSWDDCNGFMEKSKLRFLTEAEWEYACRAGTTTPFNLGDNITPDQVNYDGNYPYADSSKGIYRQTTVPCGSLPNANAWGCYDFHGNVWEWCQDNYKEDIYKEDIYNNRDNIPEPQYQNKAASCVVRGGHWYHGAQFCRSSYRCYDSPSYLSNSVGLRAARSLLWKDR